jgi:esterase/lipase
MVRTSGDSSPALLSPGAGNCGLGLPRGSKSFSTALKTIVVAFALSEPGAQGRGRDGQEKDTSMTRRQAVAAAPTGFPLLSVSRLIPAILTLGIALLVVLVVAAGVLTYSVVTAHDDMENVTPATYLLSSYTSLNFMDGAGGEHEGWLLLGLKGAPVIILSHGYDSNRSELLALGTILRENHFNVYLFNYSGPKAMERYSDLGVRQAADLMRAVEIVTKQPGINPNRVGLFGTSVGGYASLVAAMHSPKVKALAVDTIYDRPDQQLEARINKLLGGSSPLFLFLTEAEFHLMTSWAKPYPVRENLSVLQGMPKLFISGRDAPSLARITEELYNLSPKPKSLLVLEHSQSGLASGSEKKEYINQVINFFLKNLSLRAD